MVNPFKAIASAPGKLVGHVARKAWGGTAGAAVGVPVAKVALWFITDPNYGNVQFPEDIAANVSILIEMGVTAMVTLAAAYVVPERQAEA